MYLKKILIQNFKGIENISLEFKKGINLLIGDNGAGKTSVLSAVVVALGDFFQGISGVKSKGIVKDDIRIVTQKLTEDSHAIQYQFPVCVDAEFDIDSQTVVCRKTRGSLNDKTTSFSSGKQMKKYAEEITNNINAVLPIFSYQSIGRENPEPKTTGKSINDRRNGYHRCMEGVFDIKEVTDWCLRMEMESFKKRRQIPEYESFKKLVEKFMSCMNATDTVCSIEYSSSCEELLCNENGVVLPVSKLSAGYQSILFMILDIAYRLAVLNPVCKNLSDITGIILIDEIDLHLHPKWQWNVLDALNNILPNVQFIIATHSPIVISSCKDGNLIMIDEEQSVKYLENAFAYPIKDILEFRQGSYGVPKKLFELSSAFEEYVNDENFEEARKVLDNMTKHFGVDNSEVINAKWLLNLEE